MIDPNRICEMTPAERPREKLIDLGATSLTDAELLAIFLRTGIKGRNAIQLARDVLVNHGGFSGLARCSVKEIQQTSRGIGLAKAVELTALFEVGKRLARGNARRPKLDSPQKVYEWIAPELITADRERLIICLVDVKTALIRQETISIGSLTESVAHPREILRPALIYSAYGFILIHNHPSGDPLPSVTDRQFTIRLQEAAQLLQIFLLDHVIIGSPDGGRLPYFSFKEHQML